LLNGTIPLAIGRLAALAELYVVDLTTFVSASSLCHAPCRSLFSNQLVGQIPQTIGALTTLTSLYVIAPAYLNLGAHSVGFTQKSFQQRIDRDDSVLVWTIDSTQYFVSSAKQVDRGDSVDDWTIDCSHVIV
jgi:hypothetical protein